MEPKVVHESFDEEGRWHSPTGEPTVIYSDGRKEYYFHDYLHNTEDAAIVYPDGKRDYYFFGDQYEMSDWLTLCYTRRIVQGEEYEFFKKFKKLIFKMPHLQTGTVDNDMYEFLKQHIDYEKLKECLTGTK